MKVEDGLVELHYTGNCAAIKQLTGSYTRCLKIYQIAPRLSQQMVCYEKMLEAISEIYKFLAEVDIDDVGVMAEKVEFYQSYSPVLGAICESLSQIFNRLSFPPQKSAELKDCLSDLQQKELALLDFKEVGDQPNEGPDNRAQWWFYAKYGLFGLGAGGALAGGGTAIYDAVEHTHHLADAVDFF